MKHLYPAQKLKVNASIRYSFLAIICSLLACSSFSQKTIFRNASVDIVSFTAKLGSSDKIMLSVVTGSEVNASHLMIQHSTDGINFDDAALIFCEEENTTDIPRYYFCADNANFSHSDSMFFRIKVVDLEGEYKFSQTVSFSGTTLQNDIAVRLNPRQNTVSVTIPHSWQGKTVQYDIYDMQRVFVKQIVSQTASHEETLDINDLPTGRYIIKAANGKSSSEQKILKLNS
jgi:hypothetical protein